MLTVEREVFSQMRALCAEYSGGLWAFYELSNGGAFLAPTESVPMMIRVHTNDFVGTMGAQAAGITVTLFALSILALRYRDNERLSECFHQLRDFAIEHTEAAAIFAAID